MPYNNPVFFVDPDGMIAEDLIFKAKGGSKAASPTAISKTENTINNGLGGNYASIGKDGKLSLNVNRDDLKTDSQKGLYDILNTAMTAEKDVNVDVYESDKTIMGGSMQAHNVNSPGRIDIDDIDNFGTGELMNSPTVFAHEIYETYQKQALGNSDYTNESGTGAHQLANLETSKMNGGWVAGISTTTNYKAELLRGKLPGGGTRTSTVKSANQRTPYTKNGTTRYFNYSVIQGNVVKKNNMKNKIYVILCVLMLISCKTSSQNKDMVQRVFDYHIGVVENFVKAGYIDDDTSLKRSIEFLEKLTKIKSDFTEQYVMLYEPSKRNIKDWCRWFKGNKEKLYWDENSEKVEFLKN